MAMQEMSGSWDSQHLWGEGSHSNLLHRCNFVFCCDLQALAPEFVAMHVKSSGGMTFS